MKKKVSVAKRILAGVMALLLTVTSLPEISILADEAASTDYSQGFTVWFNTDGSTTGIAAGQVGDYPVYAGEAMAGKTNKITVDGTDYYSVQGTNNPKTSSGNPNGAIPTTGSYLKVTAPADGTITVYGYPASGKPFYATTGDTASLTDGNAFCADSHSYTVTVEKGEEWYFYAQGSKAQFVGVKFELPKATVECPISITGADLGDAQITFTNQTTGDAVSVGTGATSVTLTSEATYNVSINSATLVIDQTSFTVGTEANTEAFVITVTAAAKHVVSGSIKELPTDAVVTSLTFTDEAGAATSATVDGTSYSVELKNGNYTTSAEITGADGYTIYDHVAVSGTEGEAITNDVYFYAPATTYGTDYKETLYVGTSTEAQAADYATITEAVAAVKAMTRTTDQRVTLVLMDEEYVEQVIVDAANITMKAADSVTPTIRWYYGIGYKYYSIDSTGYYNEKNANDKYEMNYAQRWGSTVRVKADGFLAEGIDFVNTFNLYVCDEELGDSVVGSSTEYGQSISGSLQARVSGLDVANGTNVERAAAVALDAANAEFYKCSFTSSQDTLYTGSAAAYFNDCVIEGQTDYIFGNTGCKAIFDNCELKWLGYTDGSKAGYITATRGDYLFRGCKVTSNTTEGYTVTPGYFGRPWGTTPSVKFIGTTIAANAICVEGWYKMSDVTPDQVTFREYANTMDGTAFWSSYAKADNSAFVLTSSEATTLVDPANDSTYLGTWTPAHHVTDKLDITISEDSNSEEEESTTEETGTIGVDKAGTISNTYTLEASNLTAFAAGAKADGDTETAGTDDYFTLIYSAKSKVDSSSKTFDDSYASSQRVNFGGAASTEKNAIKFTTTTANATVKVWWVEGGDDNRQMAVLKADGSQAAVTDVTLAKNATCISTFTITDAGTYYLGGATNNNYIFKVEVTESVTYSWEETESTLEASSLTAFAAGAKADGDTEKAGTDNYFTLIYSAKSKVDSSSKTFDDGYAATQRVNFGGAANTAKNAIKFTTTSANATVKVWWVEGGDDNRQMTILDKDGKAVATTAETLAKNATCISTLTVPSAGTYYLGGATNNNYIFKVVVTEKKLVSGAEVETPRKAWADVAAPVITSAVQNGANIDVTVSQVVGYDGADDFVVTMTDANGKTSTKKSSKEADSNTVNFTPTASGTYTFSVVAERENETAKSGEETKTVDFVLPLGTTSITSATNQGDGVVELEWAAVTEATGYTVTATSTTAETVTTTVTGTTATLNLVAGNTYSITVQALRGEEVGAVGSATTVNAKATSERKWSFSAYGSSTDTAHNGFSGNINDGSVTVYSESGKGKLVPNSTDGLAFYYTTIDPDTENFTLSADITVDKWTFSNGQEGFGIMASDTIGVNGSSETVWNNSIMGMASKVEYYYSNGEVTTDTTASKITMKLGIGTLARLGVTAADVASFKSTGTFAYADGTSASIPENFTTETTTLETSCGVNGTGTYNVIGNATSAVAGTIAEPVTTLHLTLQRNNTGYIVTYSDADGNVLGQKLIYDDEDNLLTQIDPDHIYVGFFASRNARITVTNMKLTIIAPADDEAKQEHTVETVSYNGGIESATVSNSADYNLVYYGNADGTLTITDANGNSVLADGAASAKVTAKTKYTVPTTLTLGNNVFTVSFTPDADYTPGKYKVLDSYDTVTSTFTVSYKQFSGDLIYVSPNATASGTGSKNYPTTIYNAVKYVAPGQKIVLMEGTYSLSSTVKVERGIDGTADAMIYMVADPEATSRPVLDFNEKCAGMVLAGNYWYFQGFDVTKSSNGQKGIQVSGNNNVLDDIRTYKNGNTGIQIARYLTSDATKDDWPQNNLIKNCTSFLNADAGYEDADGFAAKLTIGDGNVFDGCVAAYNADDGWDCFAKAETGCIGKVTIKNCIAFKNGYVLDDNGNEVNAGNGNGFKMGGESLSGHHTLINSIAFGNKAKGIDSNSCPDIEVYNSISFDNESYNVAFYTNNAVNTAYVAQNIISYKKSNTTDEQIKLKGTQDETQVRNATNFFYESGVSQNTAGTTVTDDWFTSLDMTSVVSHAVSQILAGTFGLAGVDATTGLARNADGTLTTNGFLTLTSAAPAASTESATAYAGLYATTAIADSASATVEVSGTTPADPSIQTQIQEKVQEVANNVAVTVQNVVDTIKNTAKNIINRIFGKKKAAANNNVTVTENNTDDKTSISDSTTPKASATEASSNEAETKDATIADEATAQAAVAHKGMGPVWIAVICLAVAAVLAGGVTIFRKKEQD